MHRKWRTYTTVKHRTPDQMRTRNFVIFPNLKWSGNELVRNFVGRNKLKDISFGVKLVREDNSGMVKQQELGTNWTASICTNLLIISMSDMDETFKECLPDIPSGITITIQNKICMWHFKHNRIFYGEILENFIRIRTVESDWLNRNFQRLFLVYYRPHCLSM